MPPRSSIQFVRVYEVRRGPALVITLMVLRNRPHRGRDAARKRPTLVHALARTRTHTPARVLSFSCVSFSSFFLSLPPTTPAWHSVVSPTNRVIYNRRDRRRRRRRRREIGGLPGLSRAAKGDQRRLLVARGRQSRASDSLVPSENGRNGRADQECRSI